jgi:hypothetical protein
MDEHEVIQKIHSAKDILRPEISDATSHTDAR